MGLEYLEAEYARESVNTGEDGVCHWNMSDIPLTVSKRPESIYQQFGFEVRQRTVSGTAGVKWALWLVDGPF